MAKVPNGGIHIIVEGLARARADAHHARGQALRATVSPAPEQFERTIEVDAYVRRIHELIDRALSVTSGLSQELRGMVAGIDDPLRLAYLLSSLLDMKAEEKQQILENDSLIPKLQAVATALNREIALLELKGKIESAAQAGDDRRAAPVLPAPAAEGDPGRARRRREARGAGTAQAAWRTPTCRRRFTASRRAKSIASSA